MEHVVSPGRSLLLQLYLRQLAPYEAHIHQRLAKLRGPAVMCGPKGAATQRGS